MAQIADNLARVRERIAQAARAAGCAPEAVTLLAVSKGQPAPALREAFAAGQRPFGESYVREALAKAQAVDDLAIEWHFIGPVQSNKTRTIAAHFHWVHSVDRLKVARRLSAQRPPSLPPLNVCLQVNISGEKSKSGAAPGEVAALAAAVAALPGMRLRGLMTIPAPETDPSHQRRAFAALRELQGRLVGEGLALDTLSMGMSADLEAAVLEGATLVRVGTAIFGAGPAGG